MLVTVKRSAPRVGRWAAKRSSAAAEPPEELADGGGRPSTEAPRGQADDGGGRALSFEARDPERHGMARRRGVTDGRTEERVMDEVRHHRGDRDQQQRRPQHAPGSGVVVHLEQASPRRRIAL